MAPATACLGADPPHRSLITDHESRVRVQLYTRRISAPASGLHPLWRDTYRILCGGVPSPRLEASVAKLRVAWLAPWGRARGTRAVGKAVGNPAVRRAQRGARDPIR